MYEPSHLLERRWDIKVGNLNDALLQHFSQPDHNFDFNSARMLVYIHNKRLRQIFAASVILFYNSLNTRLGFYNISSYLSESILNSYNIFNLQLTFSIHIIISHI